MKRKMIATITVMTLFITLTAGTALAKKGPGFRGCIHPKVMKALNLTDEQKTAIQAKEAELKKKAVQLKADIKVIRIDQMQMMRDKNFSQADARNNMKKIADLKSRMDMLKVDAAVAVRDVLTDEQWKKMVELKETMGHKQGRKGAGGHCESGQNRGRGQFQAAMPIDRAVN